MLLVIMLKKVYRCIIGGVVVNVLDRRVGLIGYVVVLVKFYPRMP